MMEQPVQTRPAWLAVTALVWPGAASWSPPPLLKGMHAIPATFLQDETGTIRIMNARGDRLESAVREVLGLQQD